MDDMILKTTDLTKKYDGRVVVDNLNLTIEEGEVFGLLGPNGAGKSTTMNMICGIVKPTLGKVEFNGKDFDKHRKELIGELGYIPQELAIHGNLKAWENVELKNKLTGHQSKEQILKWFEMLGVSDKLNAKMGRMSFGQQQRVALIRALCQPFDFLFVDEPISHLDDTNATIMGQIMTEEAKKQGAGIIVTSIGKHIDLPYDQVFNL